MVERKGVAREFADQLFERIRGFGEYGFPESHAASFALLVYASAWLKRHHPAAFTAALLDSQPMGFYAPAQLVADARAHGVDGPRPRVAQESGWDSRLVARSGPAPVGASHEPAGRAGGGSPSARGRRHALAAEDGGRPRGAAGAPEALSGSSVGGVRACPAAGAASGPRARRAVTDGRSSGPGRAPFRTPGDLARRASLPRDALERLAEADALAAFGLHRRDALFDALGRRGPPLLRRDLDPAVVAGLPAPGPLEAVLEDYASLGLSLRSHPVAHVRDALSELGAQLLDLAARGAATGRGRRGGRARDLVRQRPATASGIYFFTLEDEAGVANVIVRPEVYERHRRAAREARCLLVAGTVEREGEVVHLLVRALIPLRTLVTAPSRDFR